MARVTDHEIRLLRPDEDRAALDVFLAALHESRVTDEDWEHVREWLQPERGYGAFEGDRVIGTARSFDATLHVPGGAGIPLSAVSLVGVRADRTRRGVLSELMRTQLTEAVERGDVAASLRASEGVIYGRFGYGVATRVKACTVTRNRARFITVDPGRGEVELVDPFQNASNLTAWYEGLGISRSGTMSRPERWWSEFLGLRRKETGPFATAVYRSPSGVEGFAIYSVERTSSEAVLRVRDLQTASEAAVHGLWRFLVSVDLVDKVVARACPLDAPLDLLLTDPRACSVDAVRDETWLRLLDVPSALAARTYGPGRPVVVEVTDPLLERNSGCYAVSADGVERTGSDPHLRLGVDALAMLYLGDRTATALANAGRAEVLDAAALGDADRLFTTLESTWCGTFF
jgi:predicted acetyltransferase